MMKLIKKIAILSLIASLFSMNLCYADEIEIETEIPKEYQLSENEEESFSQALDFFTSDAFKDIDVSSYLPTNAESWTNGKAEIESINLQSILPDEFSKAWNDLGDANVYNIENVNLEYANLKSELILIGLGKEQGNIPSLQEGYSDNVLELYTQTFGDFSGRMTTELPSIPESFNLKSAMENINKARDKDVQSFYKTNAYKSIINDSNYSSLFAQASQTKSMPSLLSTGQMQSMLSAGDSWASSKANSAYSSYSGTVSSTLSSAQSAANTASANSKTAYNEAVANQKAATTKDLTNPWAKNVTENIASKGIVSSVVDSVSQFKETVTPPSSVSDYVEKNTIFQEAQKGMYFNNNASQPAPKEVRELDDKVNWGEIYW